MMYIEEDENARYTYLETKPPYTSHVLTGEWFHSRCDNLPVDRNAIVPCVVGSDVKRCECHLTTNQEAYSLKDIVEVDVARDYSERKQSQYANYKTNIRSNKSVDAEKYVRNFTSLNYLVYELYPKLVQRNAGTLETGQQNDEEEALMRQLRVSQPDPLDSYGNRPNLKRLPAVPFCEKPTIYGRTYKGCSAPPAQLAKKEDMIKILGRFD